MAYSVMFPTRGGFGGQGTPAVQRSTSSQVDSLRICTPDTAQKNSAGLLADAERPLQMLQLPIRHVDLAAATSTFVGSHLRY